MNSDGIGHNHFNHSTAEDPDRDEIGALGLNLDGRISKVGLLDTFFLPGQLLPIVFPLAGQISFQLATQPQNGLCVKLRDA